MYERVRRCISISRYGTISLMKIVIVGGGFGGVKAALELSENTHYQITVVSKDKSFQYYPTLFSTATGHSHRESWVPLEHIFRNKRNIEVVYDTITKVEPEEKYVKGESGEKYRYHNLILALGSVTTYFGIPGLNTYSYGIKSESEIRALQKHLFKEMEDGKDDESHYVIIGGGATGVELAGALGTYVRTLRKHFGIRKKSVRINLVEAAPRLLPRMSKATSKSAARRLRQLGVHVETNRRVEKQTAHAIVVNGKPINTQTVIWTSGVANPPFYEANKGHFELDKRGKVVVNEYMLALPHVYVIGDNAATPYAGLAQTALHDAIFVAKHIKGGTMPYKAIDPPCIVPIGKNWSLFEWKWMHFSGWPANVLRHAADIIGYNDVLPFGRAIGAWRARSVAELRIPDSFSQSD